jgi:hypothetical protein
MFVLMSSGRRDPPLSLEGSFCYRILVDRFAVWSARYYWCVVITFVIRGKTFAVIINIVLMIRLLTKWYTKVVIINIIVIIINRGK